MVFSFLKRGNYEEQARQIALTSYFPTLTLEGLTAGVDNVRHDVYLSAKFCEQAGVHISRLITKYGNVEDLAVETSNSLVPAFSPPSRAPLPKSQAVRASETGEFKRLLSELQSFALQRAKAESNPSIDLIARLAILKFLRHELSNQFGHVLERCRARLKQYENPRHANPALGIALRDRFLNLQFRKKSVLRLAGQDLYMTMLTVEKETLSRLRRSLFGNAELGSHELLMNRLMFTDDGRDDMVLAEHYVMLGNFDRDPDRFQAILQIAADFLVSSNIPMEGPTEQVVAAWLNDPENAERLVSTGTPEASSDLQKALLAEWIDQLERNGVMEYVIASYEIIPLLGEYSPLINPQQLKNSLVTKAERERVEHLITDHGKISLDNLSAARKRVVACRGQDRAKVAVRFLRDFMRYHRDLRRLEALNSALDMINVIGNEKLRELSTINNTLYEFLLPEEQKPVEDKITHHVILKADLRDSTELTQTLVSRGLNPASYFGLNFFEPVNKLLPNYGATKVFIEGDAIILCIFGREHETVNAVARACALGREILAVVRGYNEKLGMEGLPTLELGIGICYQEGPPLYLVDGNAKIMISQALNGSDRLSSCSRGTRKLASADNLFNVYAFEVESGAGHETQLRYNIGGINLGVSAFEKLAQEISLEERCVELPVLGKKQPVKLFSGLVPLASGAFHKIILREAFVLLVNSQTLAPLQPTSQHYYEVCTSPTVYELFEDTQAKESAATNG